MSGTARRGQANVARLAQIQKSAGESLIPRSADAPKTATARSASTGAAVEATRFPIGMAPRIESVRSGLRFVTIQAFVTAMAPGVIPAIASNAGFEIARLSVQTGSCWVPPFSASISVPDTEQSVVVILWLAATGSAGRSAARSPIASAHAHRLQVPIRRFPWPWRTRGDLDSDRTDRPGASEGSHNPRASGRGYHDGSGLGWRPKESPARAMALHRAREPA